MASKKYTIEQVIDAIVNGRSWKDVIEKIGLKYAGGNVKTLKKIALKNNIDVSHFLGQGWNFGGTATNEISVENSFVKDSKLSKSNIRKKIIKYELIKYECNKCGLSGVWQGQNIVLHLDHVNGDVKDNRLENLRFLCPNCHSQTPTYCRNGLLPKRNNKTQCVNCGKNIFNNKTGFCRLCWGHKKIDLVDIGIDKEVLQEKIRRQNMKSVCKEIKVSLNVLRRICREEKILIPNFKSTSPESKRLAIDRSRKFHANKEDLEEMLRTKSILQISKTLGVSDNAIRKRCRIMDIDWKSISKFSHNKKGRLA